MLRVKDWLNSREEKQFEFIVGEYPGVRTIKRISDGVIFYEGQLIKMMSIHIYILKFHSDMISVSIKMEQNYDAVQEFKITANLLYSPLQDAKR
jgi:hypothetical protein